MAAKIKEAMAAAHATEKQKKYALKDKVEKSQGELERLLIEYNRADPSDSLYTPEGLTNEKSMA